MKFHKVFQANQGLSASPNLILIGKAKRVRTNLNLLLDYNLLFLENQAPRAYA